MQQRSGNTNECCIIITAAGSGSRMHLDKPKQFYEINGKPLIAYALESFQSCSEIDAIIIVYLDGYLEYFQELSRNNGFRKVRWFAKGGATNSPF